MLSQPVPPRVNTYIHIYIHIHIENNTITCWWLRIKIIIIPRKPCMYMHYIHTYTLIISGLFVMVLYLWTLIGSWFEWMHNDRFDVVCFGWVFFLAFKWKKKIDKYLDWLIDMKTSNCQSLNVSFILFFHGICSYNVVKVLF